MQSVPRIAMDGNGHQVTTRPLGKIQESNTHTVSTSYTLTHFPFDTFGFTPLAGTTDYYWDHLGELPTRLRNAWTGDYATDAEESRGKPLSFYCEEFEKKICRARLKFLASFGDCFVNRGRG